MHNLRRQHAPIIRCERITRYYDKKTTPALQDITLTVNSGEFVALSGASGSGKSTLLNIMGLADKPSSGALYLKGSEVNFSDDRNLLHLRGTTIGYVFQAFHLLPTLTVLENVMLTPLIKGHSQKMAEEAACTLLEKVGLLGKLHSMPHEVSGGEMQRTAVARALAHEPEILLADEPTGNLDSVSGTLVMEELSQAAKNGTTIIMASHNQENLTYCDRVIKLRDGRILT